MDKFILNNRFIINTSLNLVIDKEKKTESHLEPRLMKLLCLLNEHAGSLLSREYIYQEIWNNYGGADEGLTQAISFLRKALNDKDKKMIETIPKKGYIMHAVSLKVENLNVHTRTIFYRPWLFLVATYLAFVIILISIQLIVRENKKPAFVGKPTNSFAVNASTKPSIINHSVTAEKFKINNELLSCKKKITGNGTEKRSNEKVDWENHSENGKAKKMETISLNYTEGAPGVKMAMEKLANLENQKIASGIEKRRNEKSGSSEKKKTVK